MPTPTGDGVGRGREAGVGQEVVEVRDAEAGADQLPADVAVAGLQVQEQLRFAFVPRGEVAMSALGGAGKVPMAVPDAEGLSEPGPGRNDRDRPTGDPPVAL